MKNKNIRLLKSDLHDLICHIDDKDTLKKVIDYIQELQSQPVTASIELGDTVEIIDINKIYDLFSKMFEYFNFKNKVYNNIPTDYKRLTWKVFGQLTKHPHWDAMLVPIESNLGDQLLININGIKKLNT